MKRRTFMISAATALAGLVGWRAVSSSDAGAIVKVIHKKLNYLKLDDAGVQRFAVDMAARRTISSARLRTIDAAGPLYTHLALAAHNKLDDGIRHGEDRLITQYLMSSDFFTNGADRNRIVNYLGYYDPLVACNNPFARPVIVALGA